MSNVCGKMTLSGETVLCALIPPQPDVNSSSKTAQDAKRNNLSFALTRQTVLSPEDMSATFF
jgi:hypothetical protein